MAGICCSDACMAAVLIGVMRRPGCPFDSAWCLVRELCGSTVDWVDCRCFLPFVFLGGARLLKHSPCNTALVLPARQKPVTINSAGIRTKRCTSCH